MSASEPPSRASGADRSIGAPASGSAATTESRTGVGVVGALEAIFKHWQPLVGISGVMAYGIVALAYEAFYRHLGTTPHEVGLDRATVLTEAGEFLAVFSLVVVACVLVLVAILRGPRPWAPTLGGLVTTIGLAALFAAYALWVFVLLVLGLACVLTIALILVQLVETPPKSSGWRVFLIPCLVLLAAVIASAAAIHRGLDLANLVRAGNGLRHTNTFLEVSGDPVCLDRSSGQGRRSERPVALLGRNGGHFVLLDYVRDMLFLVPAANVIVRQVDSRRANCHEALSAP